MKIRVAVIAVAVLFAWALKRHNADARVEDLWWILAPTAHLAGVVTDTAFTLQHGEGYLSRERLFLIETSCAGVNFLVAAFGMLTVAGLRRAVSPLAAAQLLGQSLLMAYAAAVATNAARISIAIAMAGHTAGTLTADEVHRVEGIVVYFSGLLLLYEGTRWLDSRFRLPLITR